MDSQHGPMLPGPMSPELRRLNAYMDSLEIAIRLTEPHKGHKRVAVGWIQEVRHLARIIDNRTETQ